MRKHATLALIALSLVVVSHAAARDRNAPPAPRAEGWLAASIVELKAASPTPNVKSELAEVKRLAAGRNAADVERIRWWSVGGPAYRWNELAVAAMLDDFVTLPLAARNLALVQAAVDDAIAAAAVGKQASKRPRPRAADPSIAVAVQTPVGSSYPSDYAAAAAAASEVLGYLFPARAGDFAAKAEEAMRSRVLAGVEYPSDLAAGREIGRKAAALAIARGKADGSDAKWTGTVPQGPGKWLGTNPIAPMAGTWRPWVLARGNELRPPEPPAYDSEKGKADLAELKNFARTPRTNHRATYWEVFGGARAHALWNETARMKILEYGDAFDAEASARVLAMVNIALLDSAIACWDAKFAYWQMRPSHFDPEFKTVFPPPNHPSYPAAHGCLSTAAATVLAAAFPRDREQLLAHGKEAAEARVWAGIHTRSDIDVGQDIGRKVAEKVLARGGWVSPQ
jgi:membrane-associated phospholipid phosphatase